MTKPARVGIAVHPEVGFVLPMGGGGDTSDSTPGIAAVGVSAGYALTRHLEIEVALAHCLPGSRIVASAMGGGAESFDTTAGTLWRALVHYRRHETGPGLVLGAGPALVTGGSFGTVPLLDLEAGFELRASSGFYLLGVMQALEPLVVSRQEIAPARCITADCPSRFDPRRPAVGPRLAMGFVF